MPRAEPEINAVRPAIPSGLLHRPTQGGLVQPFVNVLLADGAVDFRVTHNTKWEQCWREGICQTCGLPLTERPVVFLGGPNQLAGYFTEPPLHPWCAAYAQQACPMVAGRIDHYSTGPSVSDGKRGKQCFVRGCDCGGWTPHPGGVGPNGEPAHEWWAVWAADWVLAVSSEDGSLRGGVPVGERRRRLVSRPS